MSHEYRMEQLRAAIAAARKNFKKDANFFVVGLTYGCRNCGHLVTGTTAPEVCPVCKHPQSFFEVRKENY